MVATSSLAAISDTSVLLPVAPAGKVVWKQLTATSGCYHWSSSDPSVVTVELLHLSATADEVKTESQVAADFRCVHSSARAWVK